MSAQVYAGLREAIMTVQLQPGVTLRRQVLCEQFEVSRQPVSEALAELARDGLVEVVPQRGTRVAPLVIGDIVDSGFLRQAIEVAVVERLARGAGDWHEADIEASLARQAELTRVGDAEGLFVEDIHFHRLLYASVKMDRVTHFAELVANPLERARRLLMPEPGRMAETVAEHEAIISAVRDRDDRRARRAMSAHVDQIVLRVRKLALREPHLFAQEKAPRDSGETNER